MNREEEREESTQGETTEGLWAPLKYQQVTSCLNFLLSMIWISEDLNTPGPVITGSVPPLVSVQMPRFPELHCWQFHHRRPSYIITRIHRALICPAYSGPGFCIVSVTFRSSSVQASGSKSPFAICTNSTILQIWEQRRPKSRLESLRFVRLLIGLVNITRTESSVYSNRRTCQIRFHFAHILLIKISRWFLWCCTDSNVRISKQKHYLFLFT